MIGFAHVDPATGELVQVGVVPDFKTYLLQGLEPGVDLVPRPLDQGIEAGTHYWNGDGFVPLPPRPSEHAVWDGQAWTDTRTPEDLDAEMQARRLAASLTKSEFLQASMAAGILTPQEANTAARGDIPAPFLAAVASMTPEQQDMVSVIWPSATRINRMDPLILGVAAGAGLSDETLDALFGLAPYSPD